ncbi:MAG: peptide deformylase [Bdellovibrionia bacterium]
MAKLKIYTYPDNVLAKKAQPIARVEKSLYSVADDMLETMYHAPGIGLAANQVGLLQRILVIDVDYDLEDLEEGAEAEAGSEVVGTSVFHNKKPQIIINPEIIAKEGSILFAEGCLSVPEFTAEVKRSEKLKLRYQDVDGVTRTLSADGLLAIAIQHEMDHLDGKLFIDRLSPLKKEIVRKRLRQERAEREADESMGEPSFPKPSKKKSRGF